MDVDLTAQPHLGVLTPYLNYTLTARNTGPATLTSATLTATLPVGASATNLATGCTSATTTVTCVFGSIAADASASKTFRIHPDHMACGPRRGPDPPAGGQPSFAVRPFSGLFSSVVA
ncbi:hypothetical protein [Streptomyces sp. 2131.1]|uniref:hypothetical protein n=1 Tax=Streptomyces sp. 2131.1 TaxID=1855346 RepID=UPI0021090AE3|nr:hypothetical protein [Streptomyces sp. 2131.1]